MPHAYYFKGNGVVVMRLEVYLCLLDRIIRLVRIDIGSGEFNVSLCPGWILLQNFQEFFFCLVIFSGSEIGLCQFNTCVKEVRIFLKRLFKENDCPLWIILLKMSN